MQGQANHFLRYNLSELPETYARERYQNESRRLWRVLDQHLAKTNGQYIVGDKCTIADFAIAPWARIFSKSPITEGRSQISQPSEHLTRLSQNLPVLLLTSSHTFAHGTKEWLSETLFKRVSRCPTQLISIQCRTKR